MSSVKAFLLQGIPILNVVLTMIWLANLASTDAYFIIYVLIAFFSFYLRMKTFQTVEHRREKRVAAIGSILFSLLIILANYPVFTTIGDPELIGRSTSIVVNLINTVFSLAGGIATVYPVLFWFFTSYPSKAGILPDCFNRKWFPYAVFSILLLINMLHLLLVEYPGNVTEDPFTQISEMMAGSYSNFNTFWHTMLFQSILSAGYSVFPDINAAIACFSIFQILILCFAFTYCIVTMRDYGAPVSLIAAAFLVYAIIPYNIAMPVTIWKDVLFAAGCLLMLTAWLRILKHLGSCVLIDYIVFAAGSLLFLISRTSGWILYILTFLLSIIVMKKNKKFLVWMGSMALIGWALLNPALAALGVSDGDPVESLSVPIQQVSRVIVEGGELSEEETLLLSHVVDMEEVPSLYCSWLSDPMKIELRSKDPVYFQEHFSEYRSLWIKLGLRHPWHYLKAWVDQTKGYWNAGYPYAMYSETIIDNSYGVEKTVSGNPVASLFQLYFGLSRHVILFEPLHSIGLHVWILWLCFVLSLLKKRESFILMIPLILLVAGLWLGTPVYCSFRYVYPLFVSMPLILSTSVIEN